MRNKTLVLITAGLVVAGIIIYAYREYHRTNQPLNAVKADYTVQASALVEEFLNNDSAAYHKYRNKILAVQGRVKAIDRVAGDCTIVLGDTTPLGSSVRCLLDSMQVNRVATLKRGDELTVKGAITGFKKDDTGLLGSDVEMTRCVVAH